MSLFSKNGSAANGAAEVIPPQSGMGTGPQMLLRALGLDPAMLGAKLIEFEAILKSAVNELVARAKTIDESLAEIHRKLDAMASQFEAHQERVDKNFEAIATAFACLESRGDLEAEQPAGAARATKRAKVQ